MPTAMDLPSLWYVASAFYIRPSITSRGQLHVLRLRASAHELWPTNQHCGVGGGRYSIRCDGQWGHAEDYRAAEHTQLLFAQEYGRVTVD